MARKVIGRLMFGIKSKALMAFVFVFLTILMFNAYLGISTLNQAKDASLVVGNTILLEQSTVYYKDYTNAQKETLELLIKSIEDDVKNLQEYVTRLFSHKRLINPKDYWDHKDHLIHMSNNQLVEISTDESSLWSPDWMKVDEAVLKKIETSAVINEYFNPLLARNVNTVANYFIGKEGFLRYFPKIDMINAFPPNLDLTKEIYYLPATPVKNPSRELVWSPLYEDPAGQGKMISASAPIYVDDTFLGVVGTDVTLANLVKHYIKNDMDKNATGEHDKDHYSVLLDQDFRPIALPQKAIDDIYAQALANDDALIYLSLLEYDSAFKVTLKKIAHSRAGFEKITLPDRVLYMSYIKLDSLGWLYANIVSEDELLKVTKSLNQQIDAITGKQIEDFAIPTLVFFVILVILITWLINRFLKPIVTLSDITKKIAAGEMEHKIDLKANDEVGTLINNFTSMQASINQQQERLETFNQQLQQNVSQRTAELEQSNHELHSTIDDLKQTQQQLAQADKMAALGTMTAGVAHEINNPANFTHTAVHMMRDEVQDIKAYIIGLASDDEADAEVISALEARFVKLTDLTATAIQGTGRIKAIADDLGVFTRVDNSQKKPASIVNLIESTVNLVQTQYQPIDFEMALTFNPVLRCFASKISQVLMNIIVNACQAIEEKEISGLGKVTISTEKVDGQLQIRIEDNGCGMDELTRQKIFEPFFTTKAPGQGTGLGMSISFGIVEAHDGAIEVTSELGAGALIAVNLPI
ncbi:MAG: signal transduction histidine kinase [Phenylobacterium sp.]|jgi:signal transduction histidine kinase